MQGGIQAFFSHGNVIKSAVLRHLRVAPPAALSLMFARHETTPATRMEEHGFESTTISDILQDKGKTADGSWLWCTVEDTVYDAVKSVYNLCHLPHSQFYNLDMFDVFTLCRL